MTTSHQHDEENDTKINLQRIFQLVRVFTVVADDGAIIYFVATFI